MDFKYLPEWVVWAFGGVGIPILGFLISALLKNDSDAKPTNENNIHIQNSPSIHLSIGAESEKPPISNKNKNHKKIQNKIVFRGTDEISHYLHR